MIIEKEEVKLEDGIEFTSETYIANDGKRFQFKQNCIQYEKEIDAIEKIKHIPFRVSYSMGFESWYYISSIEDFNAVRNYIATVVQKGQRTDFEIFNVKKYINDWVSFAIEHEENETDGCVFKSFKEIQEDLMNFQNDFNELENNLRGR